MDGGKDVGSATEPVVDAVSPSVISDTQLKLVTDAMVAIDRICTTGFGFTDWGSGMGSHLNTDSVNVCTYNASVYSGIRFTIDGTYSNSYLRFAIPTKDIASPDASGTCNKTLYACNDNYGVNILYSSTMGFYCSNDAGVFPCVTTSTQGQGLLITIPFNQMTQEGWGHNTTTLSSSYSLCIGAVGFY